MGVPTSSKAARSLAMAFVGPLRNSHTTLQNPHLFSRNVLSTGTKALTLSTPSSTSMAALNPSIHGAAIQYFQSSQLPTIFIAAASLVGLFAMTEGVNNIRAMTKFQIFLLRLYHVTSLLSLCLSLSSLVTSTSATTLLLLSDFSTVSNSGLDVYHFLRSNLNFEFLYARWSFLVSVPFLIVSTTIRTLLQFELFKPNRKLAGWSVASTMTGVLCFVLGYTNTTQHCWPSLWGLTQETMRIVWKRAVCNRQPLWIASVVSFGVGMLLAIRFLLPSTVTHDQLADYDGYT